MSLTSRIVITPNAPTARFRIRLRFPCCPCQQAFYVDPSVETERWTVCCDGRLVKGRPHSLTPWVVVRRTIHQGTVDTHGTVDGRIDRFRWFRPDELARYALDESASENDA